MKCANCGEEKADHNQVWIAVLCKTGGTTYKAQGDVSTLKMRAAEKQELPDDSHTTKPTIDARGYCVCEIAAVDCRYHNPN